ncbi:CHAD domain-containing protein [uncultured Friedmanniella sp.]|uniref:CYTH and CHAD domain-containing protein n=1 Tax=uncultured Friedmanniella sp. TaxID=335381 RepID=UPI0035CBA537
MLSRHTEREDKFTVADDVALPGLDDLVSPGGQAVTDSFRLVNLYHDTDERDLRQARLTLRRRTGGPDAGWQLKLPAGPARTEVSSRSRARTVPSALAAVVLGLTRGRPLVPIAELTTERAVVRLLDEGGVLLAEVADDRVSSATLGGEARLDHWREVEVELGPAGDEALLGRIGHRLVEAGASPSTYGSKLGRALGAPAPRLPEPAELTTVADVLSRYVSTQCAEIVAGDLALRLGEPQVHRTRVAIRRLRSTLRVFAPLLDPEPSLRLDTELRWFAGLLGEVRDREVLLERLQGQLADLEPELVLGPVAADLDVLLTGEAAQHLRAARESLTTARHLELLEALVRWQTEPAFAEGVGAPAKEVRVLAQGAATTMRRRLKQALRAGDEQEERLHRARKAAKRARYAAELAEPVWSRAAAQVSAAKDLQTQLGEHQDSAVSVVFLRRAGAAAGGRSGRNGFTYGLLLAREQQRAAAIRAALGVAG